MGQTDTLVKFMLKLFCSFTNRFQKSYAPVSGESVEVLSFEISWEMEARRVFGQTDRTTENKIKKQEAEIYIFRA